MHVEVSHDNHVRIDSDIADRLAAQVESALDRYGDRITRVEMHLGDTNANKGGDNDKRCMIEARLAGLSPIAVTHEAGDLQLAFEAALDKLERAVGNAVGKQKAASPRAT
jgi:ribosome-associated translation inhibitor RaiA